VKYYIDCEFIDDGEKIDLISIGIVCEDGRELYLQSAVFDPFIASQWIKDNVFGGLILCQHVLIQCTEDVYANRMIHGLQGQCVFKGPYGDMLGAYADCPWRTRKELRKELEDFMDAEEHGKPELFGWCSGYDFVAFCQLFGTMMDLPQNWPHYIKDLQQVLDDRDISDDELPEQEEGKHNALEDARHIKKLWGYIIHNDCWQ